MHEKLKAFCDSEDTINLIHRNVRSGTYADGLEVHHVCERCEFLNRVHGWLAMHASFHRERFAQRSCADDPQSQKKTRLLPYGCDNSMFT